ncbi:MAG: hypothetical protein E6Q97_10525 [Desulfurellales bacterium]|nr:MAG: hypothetical protein E6Q97_10525 [Desulfurellales bacterium]
MLNVEFQVFGNTGQTYIGHVFKVRCTITGREYTYADLADVMGVEEAQNVVFSQAGYRVRQGENWIDSDQFNDLIFANTCLIHFPSDSHEKAIQALELCGFKDVEAELGNRLCSQLKKFKGKVRYLEIEMSNLLQVLDLSPLYSELDEWLARKGCWLEKQDGIPEDFLRTHRIFLGTERRVYDGEGGHNDG